MDGVLVVGVDGVLVVGVVMPDGAREAFVSAVTACHVPPKLLMPSPWACPFALSPENR